MITKTEARGTFIDWDRVNQITEVPRTYLVRTDDGREFFKMYKPSYAKHVFAATGWTGQMVGTLRRKQ